MKTSTTLRGLQGVCLDTSLSVTEVADDDDVGRTCDRVF